MHHFDTAAGEGKWPQGALSGQVDDFIEGRSDSGEIPSMPCGQPNLFNYIEGFCRRWIRICYTKCRMAVAF